MDSVLPAYIDIGARRVAVEDVAARARFDNDMSVEEWATLQPLERDMWLVAVAHTMRSEAERGFDA